MTKQEIIDAAMQIALAGNDAHASPVIDSEMTAEDLLPHAFRHAYKILLNSGEMRLQEVLRSHTITLSSETAPYNNMSGPLPEGVLTEYLEHAFLPDFPYSSYLPFVADYTRHKYEPILCYWTVNNSTFYTSCGEDPATIELHAPSIPVIPDDPATDISMPAAAENSVIMVLARAIRGDLKLLT